MFCFNHYDSDTFLKHLSLFGLALVCITAACQCPPLDIHSNTRINFALKNNIGYSKKFSVSFHLCAITEKKKHQTIHRSYHNAIDELLGWLHMYNALIVVTASTRDCANRAYGYQFDLFHVSMCYIMHNVSSRSLGIFSV